MIFLNATLLHLKIYFVLYLFENIEIMFVPCVEHCYTKICCFVTKILQCQKKCMIFFEFFQKGILNYKKNVFLFLICKNNPK